MCQICSFLDVLGEDGGGQAVIASVSSDGNLFQGLELLDGENRPENFFFANLHVIFDIRKDGGLEKLN